MALVLAGALGCVSAAACGPDWDELDPSEGDVGAGASGSGTPGSGATGATGATGSSASGASGGGGSCVADDGLECTDDACVDGVAQHDPVAAGVPCTDDGGQLCNGAGDCVACLDDDDCTAPQTCTSGSCNCDTAETCASLGLTCGSAPDGCGGTLDCDNGVLDGTETDVDCGGDCSVPCAAGADCDVAGDCSSGFCVDGVCCQSACTATCMACNVAANIGTCVNTPQLVDDANGTMPCTLANTCDGLGACKKDAGQPCAADTECASGNCQGPICN